MSQGLKLRMIEMIFMYFQFEHKTQFYRRWKIDKIEKSTQKNFNNLVVKQQQENRGETTTLIWGGVNIHIYLS